MMRDRRRTTLLGAAIAGLVLAAVWNINAMMHRRRAAANAWRELAVCRQLAAEIASLRARPVVASQAEMAAHELGQRVDAASRQAQLDPASLEGIYPQAAGRIGDSSYLEKPTSLAFRGVRLAQVAALLSELSDTAQLRVRDLRLRVPRNEADPNLWDVEVTVASLIFSPPAMRDTTNGAR